MNRLVIAAAAVMVFGGGVAAIAQAVPADPAAVAAPAVVPAATVDELVALLPDQAAEVAELAAIPLIDPAKVTLVDVATLTPGANTAAAAIDAAASGPDVAALRDAVAGNPILLLVLTPEGIDAASVVAVTVSGDGEVVLYYRA